MATQSQISSLRILVLSPTPNKTPPQPSAFPTFLEQLTGTAPSKDITSFSGYTDHTPIHLKTKYYKSNVNIWCDELPAYQSTVPKATANRDDNIKDQSVLSEWQGQMTSTTAREVRDAIGAIILVLPLSPSIINNNNNNQVTIWANYIESLSILRDMIEDETGREVAGLAILSDMKSTPSSSELSISDANETIEALENECLATRGILGWDIISIDNNTTTTTQPQRNEHGEKMGFARIIEVLQGVNWSASDDADPLDLEIDSPSSNGDANMDMSFLDDINLASLGRFAHSDSNDSILRSMNTEMNAEIIDLKMAMLDLQNDSQVDDNRDSSKYEKKENEDDEFAVLTGAQLPQNTSDVWASLDRNEKNEAFQVDRLQGLMERVVSIREAGSEMSPAEREKFAKREISRLMRDL